MHVKTTNAHQIWQSPDGKRTIWDVSLQSPEGNDYKLKTYSADIARLGWSGDVRSYLNPRGERFVRQVAQASAPQTAQPRNAYQRDDNAIKAQWAIGQAINLASVKMDKDAITMPVIEKFARELYATVSRVKGESMTAEEQAEMEQHIRGFTQTAAAL